jgi:uncharacterized protein YutE (UPF0331/DUF86 family)
MLVIRQEQFEKVIKHSEEDFVNYLFGYVRSNHAEAVEKRDDASLRKMIRGGIKRAESHQIEKVEDTCQFIAKMVEVAPNFDEQSAIKAVLDDETLVPDKRLEKLESPVISQENWEEAKNNYDEKAWFPA